MQKVFELYVNPNENSPVDVSSTQGLKRKHTDDDDDNENMKEKTIDEQNEIVAEEATSSTNSASSHFTGAKRLRTLAGYIPDSVRTRTKTLASMAATAVVAFSFYHFSNFLPDSL